MTVDLKKTIQDSLAEALATLKEFMEDPGCLRAMENMAEGLAACFQKGGKALICGNGGSACDALHFAEECTGRLRKDRAALPVIPLMETGHLTCVANDYGYEHVFARGVEAYGRAGDILLALSTSGNSANVCRAVETAKQRCLQVYLFIGKSGGRLAGQGHEEIWVHRDNTERIQEVHMAVLHILIENMERRLFPENYRE